MKDGLQEQHFADNNAIIAAMKKWLIFAGSDFYQYNMYTHHWKKAWPMMMTTWNVFHNWKLALSNGVIL